MHSLNLRIWRFLALCVLAVVGGCASAGDPRDPLEPFNRGVYRFNESVDKAVLKPAARGYNAVVPPPVRGGVTNFFDNFRDVTTAVNNLLQAKFASAAKDIGRVAINSTVGILGVFDVASRLGLERHNEDFGQTLGVWGVKSGPYLVLPILGPSTVRDTVGLVGDYFTDPEFYLFQHSPESYVVGGVRIVNVRANLLDSEKLFEAAAMDKYTFLRDAYLQRRRSLIYDGRPPDGYLEGSSPNRKTLKELEDELDLEDAPLKDQELAKDREPVKDPEAVKASEPAHDPEPAKDTEPAKDQEPVNEPEPEK